MKKRDAQRVESTNESKGGELEHKHEETRPKYSLHNRSRKEAEKKEGRHEFQQFETEETKRTKDEKKNVHRRKRHPIRLVEYVCSG